MTLHTYDSQGKEKHIDGWDPRTGARKLASSLTANVAYGGAYGKYLLWESTMRIDPFGVPHHKAYSGDQGWEKERELWKWSQKWGQQYSVEGFTMHKDFVTAGSGNRTQTISMKACRVITSAILHSGLCCTTNQECYNIADHAFGRANAVPGIIDALLVSGGGHYESTEQVRSDPSARWTDVRREVILAYAKNIASERGACARECNMNIFAGAPPSGHQTWTLKEIGIKDHSFSSSGKFLMIRYVRSGDGERGNHIIDIDGGGNFVSNPQVPCDMSFGVYVIYIYIYLSLSLSLSLS